MKLPEAVPNAVPSELSLARGAVAVGAAAGVTAVRQLLLRVWPQFAEASDRSNEQARSVARV